MPESILGKSLSVCSPSSCRISFIVSFIGLTFGKEFWRLDVESGAADGFFVQAEDS
jgi:hypothetical protein